MSTAQSMFEVTFLTLVAACLGTPSGVQSPANAVPDSLNVVVRAVAQTRIELRDPDGHLAVMGGGKIRSTIENCVVYAGPVMVSGECGVFDWRGSGARIGKPVFGTWTLNVWRDTSSRACPIPTNIAIDRGRRSQQPLWSTRWNLMPGDSLALKIQLSERSTHVEPGAVRGASAKVASNPWFAGWVRCTVDVSVTVDGKIPAGYATVTAFPDSLQTTTDENGMATLPWLRPGKLVLETYDRGCDRTRDTASVAPRERKLVRLTLKCPRWKE
jgi:hypothetical protein